MKNSKGELLEQPYYDLAMMRREQQEGSEFRIKWDADFENIGQLNDAFRWGKTPEKHEWWNSVDDGNTPEIPAASLAELEAWQKEQKAEYGKLPVPEWVKKAPEPTEPDYKAMYECALTELKNIRALIGADENESTYDEVERKFIQLSREAVEPSKPKSTERNWVAECAMELYANLAVHRGMFNHATNRNINDAWDFAQKWAEEGKKRNLI